MHSKDESAIPFVTQLIADAIAKQASDIHIEPFEQQYRIRFRCDGLLYLISMISTHLATQVNMRLKIMGNLNTAEKRLPQDGRIDLANHTHIDIRINTCPTLFGEKLVLRILDSRKLRHCIYELGMLDTQIKLFLETLSLPQGLILVTGPTGSGKTMTLYAALNHLNQIEKNIITVEDPIEIELPGINQVNINPRIGLDFATALRSLLRQDPDIIMIGEIRDIETATIALQAAQTGHLVLATLHANSATESLSRLQSMGIDSHHLTHFISLIIAQRLVRTICQHNHATPCEFCREGYLGRTGIFELFSPTSINTNDYMSLHDAGLKKVKSGITNTHELYRVLGK